MSFQPCVTYRKKKNTFTQVRKSQNRGDSKVNCMCYNVILLLFWLYISVNWPNCFFFSLFIMQTLVPLPQTHDSCDLSNSLYINSIAHCRNAHTYAYVCSLRHPFLLPQERSNFLLSRCSHAPWWVNKACDPWICLTFSIQKCAVCHLFSSQNVKEGHSCHVSDKHLKKEKPSFESEVKLIEKL